MARCVSLRNRQRLYYCTVATTTLFFASCMLFREKTRIDRDVNERNAMELASGIPVNPELLNEDLMDQDSSLVCDNSGEKAMNLPIELFGEKHGHNNKSKNKCESFPTLKDLKFSNKYWQYLRTSNGISHYIYSAYFDQRDISNENVYTTLIIMSSKPDRNVFCLLWFKRDKHILSSKVSAKVIDIKPQDTPLNTYLVSCRLPKKHIGNIPFAVSLLEKKCEQVTNLVRIDDVRADEEQKKDFVVCVQGMSFPSNDISIRLVQWFELLLLQGVDKVILYEYDTHPNISEVLNFYKTLGKLDVIPLSLPGNQPNSPQLRHEYLQANYHTMLAHQKLPLNDCFYRAMNKYKHVVNIDLDEAVVPKKYLKLIDLVEDLHSRNTSIKKMGKTGTPISYRFQRFLSLNTMQRPHTFKPDIPKYMFMLNNIYRGTNTQNGPKSISDMSQVTAISTHYPRKCLNLCYKYAVPIDDAIVIHFRTHCNVNPQSPSCATDKVVKDMRLWKYKDPLIKNVNSTLKQLQLIV